MKITLDTNVLPADDLISHAGASCEFSVVNVTAREVEGTSYQVHLKALGVIAETAVLDESRLDEAVWAGDEEDRFEDVLRVISSGSFPKPGARDALTDPQRNQLRDAMILAAHLRDRRDIFVTIDRKAFIDHGRREALEAAFATKIMTPEEFRAAI